MKKIFYLLFVFPLLFSCGDGKGKNKLSSSSEEIDNNAKEGWSESTKKTFIENCIKGANINIEKGVSQNDIKNYCKCTLKEAMKAYPNEVEGGDATLNEIFTWAEDCAYLLTN